MAKPEVMSQQEISSAVEDLVTGLSLPGVLQEMLMLTQNWRADAVSYKLPTEVRKWEAVHNALLEAYRASVRRYDGLG